MRAGGEEAFLSGQIIDLQSRLNLANLVNGDTVNEAALGPVRAPVCPVGPATRPNSRPWCRLCASPGTGQRKRRRPLMPG